MQICDIFVGLGEPLFKDLLKQISIGKLRTYQLFERMKLRLRLTKLNSDSVAKSAHRQWERLTNEKDEQLAIDLSQSILVCHLNLIVAVLNYLGIPHEEGFFAKNTNVSEYLTDDWQQRCWIEFKDKFPASVLAFYLNHLAVETAKDAPLFQPEAA